MLGYFAELGLPRCGEAAKLKSKRTYLLRLDVDRCLRFFLGSGAASEHNAFSHRRRNPLSILANGSARPSEARRATMSLQSRHWPL